MSSLNLVDNYKRKFGAVFTPSKWADKFVEKHFFKEWLNGATVLDPTAGEGVFLKSFLNIARKQGIDLNHDKVGRLYGIELNQKYVNNFYKAVATEFSIEFPRANFIQGDIFFQEKEIKADLLVGNPPWVNFSDLEETYKEKIKHLYILFGLVKNQKDLLLGNARTDIATLVIAKALHSNLKENGKAIFFLPLSIFQNDGANQEFRNYNIRGVDFAVEDILDFNGKKIFEDILGRYGVAHFQRDKKQKFPIKYHIFKNDKWETHKAKPLFNLTDPLTVFDNAETEKRLDNFQKISLPKYCQPRQGINTCGANDIFFFDAHEILDDERVQLKNKMGDDIIISKKYVFPLTVSTTLSSSNPKPEKIILVPHFDNGKPIDIETLKKDKELFNYLSKYQVRLQNRKGVLINTWINKGFWWALMGVGEYSFASYKIMWKAFGDSLFAPKVLSPDSRLGSWQGNQSLNAYIGVASLHEAKQVLDKLTNPLIQEYLSSLRMQGTCNWAQPGRMKKLMEFV
ncbi:MAG: SAM-dependent DNA methyltransferase [Candidatus Magasanikbacteria bacterium]|nr:SAM-dependent DNA methyltransferase [Candidatus Magasanikbacteria bacterium]